MILILKYNQISNNFLVIFFIKNIEKNQLYYKKIHVNVDIFVTWVSSLSIFKKLLIECLICYLDNLVLTCWKYELMYKLFYLFIK